MFIRIQKFIGLVNLAYWFRKKYYGQNAYSESTTAKYLILRELKSKLFNNQYDIRKNK